MSGIGLSLGHGSTQASVVLDGYWLSAATQFYSTKVCGEAALKVLRGQLGQDQIHLDDSVESRQLLNCIKNSMQIDDQRDMRFQLPDGEGILVRAHVLQNTAKLYTHAPLLGFDAKPLAQSLDELAQQIPQANIREIKTLHISGGMANCKQLVSFLGRKWFYENIRMTTSLANPQYDAYIGAQAVIMCAPDAAFISKKDFQEKGVNCWDTKKKD